jgi:hypothetical protein
MASAKALAFENVKYAFRLGQQVQHKIFGEYQFQVHLQNSQILFCCLSLNFVLFSSSQVIELLYVGWIQSVMNQNHGWRRLTLISCLKAQTNPSTRFL